MNRLVTILFISVFYQFSIAQSPIFAALSGTVQVHNQEVAAFATAVVYSNEDREMIKVGNTNENGQFTIPGIPAGSYVLEISYVGYSNLNTNVFTISSGESKDVGILLLQSSTEELNEILVKAKRPMIEVKPDKTIFNVAGSINAQGGNALELLRKAPGVILDNNESILLLGKTGVIVYIDGKPSPLSSTDLANYLKGLSASSIDNIEVITNPSSKYEAEGNAGIINIRLRKSENIGTNLSLTTGLSTSSVTSYDGGIQINTRGIKSNVFAGYNYSKNENFQEMMFKRTINSNLYDQKAEVRDERTSHNLKVGADYYINDKSTIGVLVNAFVSDGTNLNSSHSDIFLDKSTNYVDSILNAKNYIIEERDNYSFNINYALNNKKGRSINIDMDYGRFSGGSDSDQPNDYLDGQSMELAKNIHYGSDAVRDIDIYTFKTDVEQPAWKGTLGFGVKLALVKTDNDFQFFNVVNEGMRQLDQDRSNRFLYDENVNAVYVNFQRGNDKWNYQLGLRIENTASKGELKPMNGEEIQENKRNYTNLFPSAGVTYTVNPKNTLRLTYSRRLNRPNYQDLNPFEFKLDELAFQKGNPFLNPEYTNNFQIGHTYNYTLNTTISYSRTEDLITRITDTEDGRQAFITWENLASQDALSLSVSYPYSPTEWWSLYFNVSGNYINNKSKAGDSRFTADRNVDVEATFVSIFGQNTIQLPKDFTMEISGFYNSPGIWGGNFKTDEYWNVDLGLQKKMLDDKLSVKIGVSDVFWGQQWHATNDFGPLSIDAQGRNQTRRFKINLSYNFGNDQVKSRRRSTGLEDERKRTNSSGGL